MYVGKKYVDTNLYKTKEILILYIQSCGIQEFSKAATAIDRSFMCFCPLKHEHQFNYKEHTPSFRIGKLKKGLQKGTWGWKCFSCGRAGDIFTLIENKQQVSFPTALWIVRNVYARGINTMKGASSDINQLKLSIP
jgi:hypothetical protein